VPTPERAPAAGATTAIRYRVPFFDTDAMQVVHHANYVRYLELARLQFLEEYDAPYARYLEQGLHFAVTRCELSYRRPARFGDELTIRCWLQRVGGASLALGYEIARGSEQLATACTEHALIDAREAEDPGRSGVPRVARIPRERLRALRALVARAPAALPPSGPPARKR
jgi:acyl-CoA thioester hydrolase